MKRGREKKSASLTRRMTTANFSKKREKLNLFQKKRKILGNIEKKKCEILKGRILYSFVERNVKYSCSISGTKEKQALWLIITTYTKTPEFGDAAKFQQELELVMVKLERQEEDLTILNRDLDLVKIKLNLNI